MEKNIKFDFSAQGVENQELAVMPANLAIKLLRMMSEKLVKASSEEVVGQFIDNIRANCLSGKEMSGEERIHTATLLSLEFIQERELIKNISANNWNAYSTLKEEQAIPASELPNVPEKVTIPEHYS